MTPRRASILAVVAALFAMCSPVASAAVLVDQGSSSIACGADIEMAVWYQEYSGGPRWAKLTIKSINGSTLMSKRVTATTMWRSYSYTPRCGRRYRVIYTVPGGRSSYTVRVRS